MNKKTVTTKRTRAVVELIEAFDAYCEQCRAQPRDPLAIALAGQRVDAASTAVSHEASALVRRLVHGLQPCELVSIDLESAAVPSNAFGVRRPATRRRARSRDSAA